MSSTHVGRALIGVAVFMLLGDIGRDLMQWQTWMLPTPQFIGNALIHISEVGMAALGGKLLPQG